MHLSCRDFLPGRAPIKVAPREPQPVFPEHDHEFEEIVLVLSGSGAHVFNDRSQLISAGDLFYLGPGDRHMFQQVNDLHLVNVMFRRDAAFLNLDRAAAYLPAGHGGQPRQWQVTEDTIDVLRRLIDDLDRESRAADPSAEMMAEALFLQLAALLRRHRFVAEGQDIPERARLAYVIAYMRQNWRQDLPVDELARRFGYSARTFNRRFRDGTGTTPAAFLTHLRLLHASDRLRLSQQSVTDTALACGFCDSNYFSHAFHRAFGMTPSLYRRSFSRAAAA